MWSAPRLTDGLGVVIMPPWWSRSGLLGNEPGEELDVRPILVTVKGCMSQ
jgi:hypothetical protein